MNLTWWSSIVIDKSCFLTVEEGGWWGGGYKQVYPFQTVGSTSMLDFTLSSSVRNWKKRGEGGGTGCSIDKF